ncbi:uncharacterized protein LOC130685966 [Daphnia carinata]|uniref:uncharacterized protein LOC130685966 n=1 Tax=Daphnia carinata TaxID=120202 RepID=UPI00257A18FE|nr:uncharacterized protein LOC130685966 [Daphnia carinata]
MRSQSTCGFLALVVLGCVLPSILAAPSIAAAVHEENGLELNNGRNDRNENRDSLAVASKLVQAYGSDIAKVAARVCDRLAHGETIDKVMLEIAKEEGMDKIDMKQVREMIEKFGCSATKWTCLLWGAVCWGR